MKMKRLMAGLLSLVMMIGTVGATEVKAAETDYGTEIASNLTTDTFMDESADPNEDYVYTVVGSDGSVAEISTNDYDGIVEGYWRVTWEEGSFNSNTIQDGQYLIVNRNLQRAIMKDDYCSYGGSAGGVTGDVLYDEKWDAWEWTIKKVGDKYTISTGEEPAEYMKINYNSFQTTAEQIALGKSAVSLWKDPVKLTITTVTPSNEHSETTERNTVFIGDVDVDGWLNRREDDYAGTWYEPDAGSCIRLYKRGYRFLDEKLADVTDEVSGTAEDYMTATWNAYQDALNAAKAEFSTKAEAKTALDTLIKKVAELEETTAEVASFEILEENATVESGKYLIVSHRYDNGVMSNVSTTNNISFALDVIDDVADGSVTETIDSKYVWSITKKEDNSGYTFQDKDKKYVFINNKNASNGLVLRDDEYVMRIIAKSGGTFAIGVDGGFFNQFTWDPKGVGTYTNENDDGGKFYLFKASSWRAKTSLVEEVKNSVGAVDLYTVETGNAYKAALAEAEKSYSTKAEAEAAFANLIEQKEALEQSKVTKVYVKLKGTTLPEDGNYLISPDRTKGMGLYVLGNETITSTADNRIKNLKLSKVDNYGDSTSKDIDLKYVWSLKKVDGGYYITNVGNGKYLTITHPNSPSALQFNDNAQILTIASGNTYTANTFSISGETNDGTGYMNSYRQTEANDDEAGMGTYYYSWNNGTDLDAGNRMYLYQEKGYVVVAEALESITENVKSSDSYTATTWNSYESALKEMEQIFETKAEAETAFANLCKAKEALKEVDYSVLKVSFDRYDIDDTKTPIVENGIYAIVGAHFDGKRYSQNKAIKNGGGFMYEDLGDAPGTAGPRDVYDSIPENKLQNSNVYAWEFKSTSPTQNSYHVKSVQMGTYMNIASSLTLQSNPSVVSIRRDDNPYGNAQAYRELGAVILYNGGNVINHNDNNNGGKAGIWGYQTDADNNYNNQGNAYYLYKKQYRVDTAVLEAMVDPNGVYDAAKKAVYDAALTEAKAAVGNAGVVYEKYLELEEATNNLVSTMVEGIIPAAGLTAPTGWTKNTASMDAKLTLGASTLVKTDKALVFDLLDASAFELLATCGNNTGMVMAVVKDANGKTLRSYLVDTYYDVTTPKLNVPIVRNMMLEGGATVDVYACLVASVVGNRKVSTMGVRGREVEVTTDDIVMALLEELGLDNELDVADVNVSYMSEDSVLNGGTSSSINTYAVAPMSTGNAENNTEYTVSVQGCRIYKPANGVEYKALSDLVADGKTAFISKGGTEFVLADYQKTGPQNEIYLAEDESIVIGLASAPSADYSVSVTAADGTRSYRELEFKQVEGEEGFVATIKNEAGEIALGMIKMSSVSGDSQASPSFAMTNAMAKAVLAVMNADADVVVNPFEDVTEDAFFYDAVLWALDEKITKGVSETLFAPDRDCTRAEVVTFLWRAAGKPEATDVESKFVDVVEGSFYEDAVLWAVENGITKGRSEKEFRPNDVCTRAEVVTFLWRAAGRPEAADAENKFVDVVEGSFYEDAVLWAVENRITKGVNAECFAPNDVCVRGQVVTFLYRAMSE